MTERDQQSTADHGLREILEIACNDATQRADMWADFAKEFLRLGMLAQAMRGPAQISEFATRAAMACRDTMTAEINLAEKRITLRNEMAPKPEPGGQNADAPALPRTQVATEPQSEGNIV